jgi:ATP-binding cassette subfamily B protein
MLWSSASPPAGSRPPPSRDVTEPLLINGSDRLHNLAGFRLSAQLSRRVPGPDPLGTANAESVDLGEDAGGSERRDGQPAEGSTPGGERRLYRRLARELRAYWPMLLGLLALSMLATPLTLLAPVPLKIVVDNVLGSHPLPPMLDMILPSTDVGLLIGASVLFVTIALLTQLQDLAATFLRTVTGERLLLDFRTRLFRHLQRLSVSYHDLKGTTDSTYRIQYDAMAMQQIAVDSIPSFVTAMFTVVSMLCVTALIDRQLALVAIAVSPVLFAVSWRFRSRLRRQSQQVKKLESGAMSVVQEALAAARVVQAFGREDHEERRFVRHFHDGMRARIRYILASSQYALLVGLTTAAGAATVLYVGAGHVLAGLITVGELILVMSYLLQLYAPLKTMSKRAGSLQGYLASAERVFALLDEDPDVKQRPDARPLRSARGDVVFDHASFSYDGDRPVLEDVSIHIRPGTRVGVAGTTGAGKTTLVSLLNRFYDPTRGRVLFDGVDLRDYRLADLRNQFAIVLQEPLLFSTSIAENIVYARPGAGFHDIVAAAISAGAHDFISALPDGYATLVGERGVRLSGGERQRISLARAFLKDAPVLILDEPTSSVDARTEAAIMEAMYRLMEGRTTFMIAHRLSTLEGCDERIEISAGRVVKMTDGVRPGVGWVTEKVDVSDGATAPGAGKASGRASVLARGKAAVLARGRVSIPFSGPETPAPRPSVHDAESSSTGLGTLADTARHPSTSSPT